MGASPYRRAAVVAELDGIGGRLRALRMHHNMTAPEAYHHALQGNSVLWRTWEAGNGLPPLRAVGAIAITFEISLDWLVLGKGEKPF